MSLLCDEYVLSDNSTGSSNDSSLVSDSEPDMNRAKADLQMTKDPRIVENMLLLEKSTVPHCDYFATVQTDIKPFMRKLVTIWMLELCDEQRVEEQVFPLAINFMDRFLCVCNISRQQLQLLGATCLLVAAKIRQCHSLPVDLLCAYTDCTITPEQVKSWELLLLASLQWNVSAITGYDYVDHILRRVPWGCENPHIRTHAHTLVSVCLTEYAFMQSLPSVLASACVCAATRGINSPSARRALGDVVRLTRADPLEVEFAVRHIEIIVAKQAAAMQQQHQEHLKLQYQSNKLPTTCSTEVYQSGNGSDFKDVYF